MNRQGALTPNHIILYIVRYSIWLDGDDGIEILIHSSPIMRKNNEAAAIQRKTV